jgi:hypothetical protein
MRQRSKSSCHAFMQVLCTTSTLAMGVNLPAHLVVLKGTVRWVGDSEVAPGDQPGYKEYSQTEVSSCCRGCNLCCHGFCSERVVHPASAAVCSPGLEAVQENEMPVTCSPSQLVHCMACQQRPGLQLRSSLGSCVQVLQMVGRAGRPQFDTEGVAVIMTSRDSSNRYQRLLAGQVKLCRGLTTSMPPCCCSIEECSAGAATRPGRDIGLCLLVQRLHQSMCFASGGHHMTAAHCCCARRWWRAACCRPCQST